MAPGPLNIVIRQLGGAERVARLLDVPVSRVWFWRKGTRPIPRRALDMFTRALEDAMRDVA